MARWVGYVFIRGPSSLVVACRTEARMVRRGEHEGSSEMGLGKLESVLGNMRFGEALGVEDS